MLDEFCLEGNGNIVIKTKKYKPIEKLSELIFSLCGKKMFEWTDIHCDMITNNDETLLQYTPLCKDALYHKLSVKKCELHLRGTNIHSINFPNHKQFEGEALIKILFDLCDLNVGQFLFTFLLCHSEKKVLVLHGGEVAECVFSSLNLLTMLECQSPVLKLNSVRGDVHIYFDDKDLSDLYLVLMDLQNCFSNCWYGKLKEFSVCMSNHKIM